VRATIRKLSPNGKNAVEVSIDNFDLTLPIADTDDEIRIYFSKNSSLAFRQLPFPLYRTYLIESPMTSYVYSDAVMRLEDRGAAAGYAGIVILIHRQPFWSKRPNSFPRQHEQVAERHVTRPGVGFKPQIPG
jgi:hypothetical protein